MNIPHLFTRVRLCPKCLVNQKPYPDKEAMKGHVLRYAVRAGTGTDTEQGLFKLRTQSKPGKIGFTPHLFQIASSSKFKDGKPLYRVSVACSIEGCGCVIALEEGGLSVTFTNYDEFYKTEEEIVEIYNFKDDSYWLDSKEDQVHLTPFMAQHYFPN